MAGLAPAFGLVAALLVLAVHDGACVSAPGSLKGLHLKRAEVARCASSNHLAPLRLKGGEGAEGGNEKDEWGNPPVVLDNIAKFNNWDHRECCVSNAEEWKTHMDEFLKNTPGDIPKKIHQIWVGPRQPPIVWLDTWRKKYRSEYPGWDYKLWGESEVAELKMRNQDLYDEERMFQCKADILRLEILWEEGGVYIDADMVWLHKDLQDVLDLCKDTGFFCGYEPDTKDKPYSVIGNSFLAATPKHPLVDMLIKYIRGVYPHKRPYHGVEWVTGPLAYTKCISHTKMPWTVPPQVWFYPKFHYVPNPDAINLQDFPHSYAFQFGYTCSGLEGWVANSIKRCTLDNFWLEKCPQLKDLNWPLGKLAPLPTETPETKGPIPKVIHQFAFQGSKPERWMKTWSEDFCRENPGWTYKCWNSIEELKNSYFCCNQYSDEPWQMDAMAMRLLSLEVLFKHGGYHVPLTIPWSRDGSKMKTLAGSHAMDPNDADSCFSDKTIQSGWSEVESLRIIGSTQGGGNCLEKIKQLIMMDKAVVNERFLAYPDSISSYLEFPTWTRFLGAEEMYDLCAHPSSDRAMLSWSYDSTVSCLRLTNGNRNLVQKTTKRCVVVTDPELFHFKGLMDAIPGFLNSLDQEYGSWQLMLIALEWECGEEGITMYKLITGQKSPKQKIVGVVCNAGWAKLLPNLDGEADWQEVLYSHIFAQHHHSKLFVGTEKFTHDRDLANIYRAIPSIQYAFKTLANHDPPIDHDHQERNGNTLKAIKHGQTRFELQVDSEHRATFRAFNEDGAINCEARVIDGHAGKRVEFMKVFYNHAIVFEKQNVMV